MNELADLEPILSQYPPSVAADRWTPLGSAGGFSGARIWQGVTLDRRTFALKAFPIGTDASQLKRVHWWMLSACAAGVDIIPFVESARDGNTVIEWKGRCWEITTWMPGRADFLNNPSDAKLFAAVAAVARIHEAWAASQVIVNARCRAPCPAVQRRWKAIESWEHLVFSGWRPRFHSDDPITPHAQAAWNRLPANLAEAKPLLAAWLERPVDLQPCIVDVWHNHILFDDCQVTGVIDFAAAKVDHVAADLARLLGSLIPDQPARMEAALDSYLGIRLLPDRNLVYLLDRSGLVASIANWLRRLYAENEPIVDANAVANRLASLVQRLR